MSTKYGMALFLSLLLAASLPQDAAAQNGNGHGGGGGDPVCWWCVEDYRAKCQETLQTADANGIARVLRTVPSLQFFPDGISIRALPECGNAGTLLSYSIPAGLAAEVAALLAE